MRAKDGLAPYDHQVGHIGDGAGCPDDMLKFGAFHNP